jgi:hypothetical protein
MGSDLTGVNQAGDENCQNNADAPDFSFKCRLPVHLLPSVN